MKNQWKVNESEFLVTQGTPGLENLQLINDLPLLERLVALVAECALFTGASICIVKKATHGGYLPISVSPFFNKVLCVDTVANPRDVTHNLCKMKRNNVFLVESKELFVSQIEGVRIVVQPGSVRILGPETEQPTRSWEMGSQEVVVAEAYCAAFERHFAAFFDKNILHFDNLIHLCVMVKNGGDLFGRMLRENLHLVDRWTVLDTGSTDNTVATVRDILGGSGRPGVLYQEPFINFRDSRNRCLDLAQDQERSRPLCKYFMMLDDTYIIRGNLRGFLEMLRGDQYCSSLSLNVHSADVEYLSNRITKACLGLRYKYLLHEIIQEENNVNAFIPAEVAHIEDITDESMLDRTVTRKQYDLECLFRQMADEPTNPRHVYYIAQTYSILEKWTEAAEYFRRRLGHNNPGYSEEYSDSLFELTRLEDYRLGFSWEHCRVGYERYSVLEPLRPDGEYFLGIHYYNNGDHENAYPHFLRAFEIGFPGKVRQTSLRPTISNHFTPLFLTELAYNRDSTVGIAAAVHLLTHSKIATAMERSLVNDWLDIHRLVAEVLLPQEIVCFVAPGGIAPWDGNSNRGPETWIIETARHIKALGNGEVVVFCNCGVPRDCKGVSYLPIAHFPVWIRKTSVTHCVVSRFSEYVSAALAAPLVKNVHFILHDILPSGKIIPLGNPRLRNIFCLSEWHRNYFLNIFPQFHELTHVQRYGVLELEPIKTQRQKIPASFIYSSLASRGLARLLCMWPLIRKRFPMATLAVFCDLKNQGPEIELLKAMGVTNYGLVSKPVLAQHWSRSQVWLYPCNFAETFCHTALEAAASQTLVITNGLAALAETASSERTVSIPECLDWEDQVLQRLNALMDSNGYLTEEAEQLVEKNLQWSLGMTWTKQTTEFLMRLAPDGFSRNLQVIN